MKVHIVSQDMNRSFDVAWLDVYTPQGNMVVLEDHAPFLGTLVAGKPITLAVKGGKQELVHLQRAGVIEIFENSVTVVL